MRKCTRLSNRQPIRIVDIVEPPVTKRDVENYGKIAHLSKRIDKNADGKYYVDNRAYDKLIGTREEVWDGTAYKTAGGLLKHEFTFNKSGKLVSIKKSIHETAINRLQQYT